MNSLLRFRLDAVSALAMLLMPSIAQSAADPKVVVTLKPVHALVSQLMEGVGVPVLIVDGSASPHTFTLKPSAARAIQDAEIFIRVSDRVEPFTRKIVAALPKTTSLITLTEQPGIKVLDQRSGGTFEAHHEAGTHDDDELDPNSQNKDGHIWLDPSNAKAIVAAVSTALVARYPAAASRLTSNADKLKRQLDDLQTELVAQLQSVKDKPFIVFHDATQYFENRFGLTAVGSITVSLDVQPSAKRLTAVRRKIAELGAVCVFAEPEFQPNLVAAVTEGTTAKSGTIDAEAQTFKPGPALYFDMMRTLARNITSCLKPVS